MNWKESLKKLMKQEYGNNDELSESKIKEFIESLLKEQREICAEAFMTEYGLKVIKFAESEEEHDEVLKHKLEILNAPEPIGIAK